MAKDMTSSVMTKIGYLEMVHKAFILLLLLIFITSCTPKPSPIPSIMPANRVAATLTSTITPIPTHTPTTTPKPTSTTTPIPQPVEVISESNIENITKLSEWGTGFIWQAGWSPDGKWITLKTSTGVELYDSHTYELFRRFASLPSSHVSYAYSYDSQLLAVGDIRGNLKVYNIELSAEIQAYVGHQGSIWNIAFSHNGERLVSSDDRGTFILWDVPTGQRITSLQMDEDDWIIAFSPDDSSVYFSDYDRSQQNTAIKEWTSNEPAKVRTLIPDTDFGTLSGNGKYYFSTSAGVRVYDMETGLLSRQINVWSAGDRDYAVSPDGTLVAVSILTRDRKGAIVIVNTETGDTIRTLTGLPGDIAETWSMAFSPDNERLVATSWTFATVFDLDSGISLFSWNPWTGEIIDVAFSPDGGTLAVFSRDWAVRILTVPDLTIMRESPVFGKNYNLVHAVAYSPDGRYLAKPSENSPTAISVVDPITGVSLQEIDISGYIYCCMKFSPDSQYLGWVLPVDSSLGNNIILKNLITGEVRAFRSAPIPRQASVPNNLAFSPDGTQIAYSADGQVIVWNIDKDKLVYRIQTDYEFPFGDRVAFSPDGHLLAYPDEGSVRIFNVRTGQNVRRLVTGPLPVGQGIHSVQFSPDGNLLAVARWDQTQIWSVRTGENLITLETGFIRWARVAFSPDGKLLVSGGDGKIYLWGIKP